MSRVLYKVAMLGDDRITLKEYWQPVPVPILSIITSNSCLHQALLQQVMGKKQYSWY